MTKLVEAAARYHIDIHGPLPAEPAEFATPLTGGANHSPDMLKALNHRWIEAFNARDWATERAVRGDDFRAHISGSPAPLDNNAWSGFMNEFTTAFPDAHITIESCIGEGAHTSSNWTMTGSHRATFNGIPATGRKIQIAGIEFNHFVDGRVEEHFAQFDLASLMQQLGTASRS
jgi:steroid delta-isomerase-like uncharacterized protein